MDLVYHENLGVRELRFWSESKIVGDVDQFYWNKLIIGVLQYQHVTSRCVGREYVASYVWRKTLGLGAFLCIKQGACFPYFSMLRVVVDQWHSASWALKMLLVFNNAFTLIVGSGAVPASNKHISTKQNQAHCIMQLEALLSSIVWCILESIQQLEVFKYVWSWEQKQ